MIQENLPGFDVEIARLDAISKQKCIDEETRQRWLASKFAQFHKYKEKINKDRALKCIYFMSHKTY